MLEHQATHDQLQTMQQEIMLAQTEIHDDMQKLRSEIPNLIEDGVSQLSRDIRREIDQTMKNSLYILFQENERITAMLQGLIETFTGPDQEHGRSSMSLPQSPRIILEYFSGQHNVDSSGLTGPQGMMRSLLDQLLQQWPDEAPLSLHGLRRPEYSRDLPTPHLCDLFEGVVRQLPRDFPIWCVVDNVSHFETSLDGWADELADTVECFWRCVHGQWARPASAPVKFLLATANRSMYIWEQIPRDHQIDLVDDHLHIQSQGPNIFRALLDDD
ncbi:hypothetical protein ACO1O0_000529 [Amphichorda felina]